MSPFEKDGPQKIEGVLQKILKKSGKQSLLPLAKIAKHWELIVGVPLAKKTRPAKLIKKTLHVVVKDAAYSHHLRFYESHILELIRSPAICGEGEVEYVKFKVGPIDEIEAPDSKDTETKPAPQPTEEVQKHTEEVSSAIHDQKTKRAFSSFMKKTEAKNQDPKK